MFMLLNAYTQSRSRGSWASIFFFIIIFVFVIPVQSILFFINIMSFNFGQALWNLTLILAVLLGWDLTKWLIEKKPKKKETTEKSAGDKLAEAMKE